MRLRIILPLQICVDAEVSKISAEGAGGSFTLLQRHVDCLNDVARGILSFTRPNGEETYYAIDSGILTKVGSDVSVSTRDAIEGPHLGELRRRMQEEFQVEDERERKANTAASRLEADMVRRLMDLRRGPA